MRFILNLIIIIIFFIEVVLGYTASIIKDRRYNKNEKSFLLFMGYILRAYMLICLIKGMI